MVQFDIYHYVSQYLSPLLRKIWLLELLRGYIAPLLNVYNEFDTWREQKWYEKNITPQTLSLQSHLNKLFDRVLKRILIRQFDDFGLFIPLSIEAPEGVPFGLKIENSGLWVAKKGEVQLALEVSFLVYIPAGVNESAVRAEVEKYKLAGKSYEIRQNN